MRPTQIVFTKFLALFGWNVLNAIPILAKFFVGLGVREWKVDDAFVARFPVLCTYNRSQAENCRIVSVNTNVGTVLPFLPIVDTHHRRGQTLIGRQLQGIDTTKNLVKIASGRGRIGHHQGDRLVRFENVHGPDREWQSVGILVAGIQNAQLYSRFTGRIAKEGVLKAV